MRARTGFRARAYVAGKEAPGVQDITMAISRTEIQVKSRGSSFIKYLAGLKDVPVDFEMNYDPSDEAFIALKTAFHSNVDDNYIEIEITDKPKTSAQWEGIKADWVITKFEKFYPIDDVAKVNVSIRLAAESSKEPVETSSVTP